MRLKVLTILLSLLGVALTAQDLSNYIVVDQFGYLPGSRKVAVIRDPQVGIDAAESFHPGAWYAVVNATTGEKIYRAKPAVWGNGITDAISGDRAWHFDFSTVTSIGTYYILDEELEVRSFDFIISHNVYNEVLRQAMRSFFYQRAGFRKDVSHAGEAWADEASHVGYLQDYQCRSFFDMENPDSERDVSGGWYDAGDFNKYTNWTSNYIVELMKAYLEHPNAWGDDYNIPESGNGIPDILDEAKWGTDHLLRMQLEEGGVLTIVGESHASPPSAATGPSYYGPPSTSATLNTSAALAMASGVYRSIGMDGYADTLLNRALLAWDWAGDFPDSLFNNNDPAYGSLTLGAGRQELDDYGRDMARLEAACYLFGETGNTSFRDYFDSHYQQAHMFQWTHVYPYEALNQEMLLYYTGLSGGTGTVQDHIRNVYRNAMLTGGDNLHAYTIEKDPYLAHLGSYVWGSNGIKASQGSMSYNLVTYGMDEGISGQAVDAAEVYIHYLHGVNPLNFVYLSNMFDYGADHGVSEFYHSWFSNGSPRWDRVGVSTYGPAPGFLTGGPNPGYDWDGCCPSGCGSSGNNALCMSESIAPPKDQPPQKSYKDFNTSWPLNSWEVTENSCGYQVRYIRLLSKFVTAGMDCNGEPGGAAFMDSCGVCAGGSTGIIPTMESDNCGHDPIAHEGDTMYVRGRHLYSAAGEKVILRGVNEMFVWSNDKSGIRLLPEIAQTGANCVRLVWTEEEGNKETLVQLIENCIDLHMIAMPECHSATGEWENLDICINFWKSPLLIEAVQRNRQWTLLNIGNEVGDGSVTDGQFKEGYQRAIDSLREWGYTVPIVIDASNWGQDVDVVFNTWEEILDHDPLHNILFSVHSYWGEPGIYNRVATESVNNGLPVIIGEGPSPTRYPTCELLDYGTGLDVAGRNDLGWLSWSWGGVPNGHCIPDFDHTYDGYFGDWRTSIASDMMVEHPFSLMRTAQRPPSFFLNDTVQPAGIHISPFISSMMVGDTVTIEVLVAPANAFHQGYTVLLSGDGAAVDYDPATGELIGVAPGTVQLTAKTDQGESIAFTRSIQVLDIPVTTIEISPAEAAMVVGDTIYFSVKVLPEEATIKSYAMEVIDTASVIDLDPISNFVAARKAGTAQIIAKWVNGNISGKMDITVSDLTPAGAQGVAPQFTLYPNPSDGMLHVSCNQEIPVKLKILDLEGRMIVERTYTGQTVIDTSTLTPGSYIVIQSNKMLVKRDKLIML